MPFSTSLRHRLCSALWPDDSTLSKRLTVYRWIAIVCALIAVVVNSLVQIKRRDGDPYLFLDASRLFMQGRDLYFWVSPHGNSFYYPPLFSLLMVPLTLIPPAVVIFLWSVASIILLAWSMATFLSALVGQPFFSIAARTRWAICFWSTVLTFRFIVLHLRFGQTNLFLLALTILSLVAISQSRRMIGGVTVGLSIVIKLITAPFTIWFLGRRETKVLAGIILGIVLGVSLPAVAVGVRKDIEYHRQWLSVVALGNAPGSGNWAGVGNISLRAQLDRFFLDVPAFPSDGALYRVTIMQLPPRLVRLFGYVLMLAVCVAVLFYAVRFRSAPELVSRWGGAAFVFSLCPMFSPVTEIPHLVLLIPAYMYVVHLWYSRVVIDRLFKWLIVLSFLFASLTTRGFMGVFISRLLTAWGVISLGMLLLSAAIVRAAIVICRVPALNVIDKSAARDC